MVSLIVSEVVDDCEVITCSWPWVVSMVADLSPSFPVVFDVSSHDVGAGGDEDAMLFIEEICSQDGHIRWQDGGLWWRSRGWWR